DVHHGKVPAGPELVRQPSRRDVAAPACARGITWNEGERSAGRRWNDLDHHVSRGSRELPAAAFLPLADEGASASVVGDGRPCARKGETTARAFGTAPYGPRPGRPAALANWLVQPDELSTAAVAERPAESSADRAALGQEQVEHLAMVGWRASRVCA